MTLEDYKFIFAWIAWGFVLDLGLTNTHEQSVANRGIFESWIRRGESAVPAIRRGESDSLKRIRGSSEKRKPRIELCTLL